MSLPHYSYISFSYGLELSESDIFFKLDFNYFNSSSNFCDNNVFYFIFWYLLEKSYTGGGISISLFFMFFFNSYIYYCKDYI
jgi:hypothetical protein